MRLLLPVLLCSATLLQPALHAQFMTSLKPEALAEFRKYQANVDAEISLQTRGARRFLWVDQHSDAAARAKAGEVVTHAFTGANGLSVPGGLIHDWVGAVYVPGIKLAAARDFLIDSSRHTAAYSEVKAARDLSKTANTSVTKLRLVKKKVLTATLDIEYDNVWQSPAPGKWVFSARSRKVEEVEDAGTPKEKALAPDTGHGFLWRMNSHWMLREDTGGVWIELRSVSLSRDTPRGLGWAIKPLIRDFPAEGLTSTLRQTQQALSK